MKLVVFDFDGTLVDSRALIFESHRIVFPQFGLPVPPPAYSLSLVGKSLRVILNELAGPDAPLDAMINAYDQLLPQLRADPLFAEQPFEGAGELLQALNQRHATVLALATGHRSDTVAPALQTLRWTGFFRTVQAADMAPSKPHPAMLHQALAATGVDAGNALFVGDTTFDMQMARAAGLRSIGVSWGYHNSSQLMDAGAGEIVATFDELRTAIELALDR